MKVSQVKAPRLSSQGIKILSAFTNAASAELSGVDVHRRTGLASGTLYPILMRFEEAGWLRSRWEAVDPRVEGRPRKRLYCVTASGIRAFQDFVSAIGVMVTV